MRFEYRLDLGELATFKGNRDLPVYRWFYYKEGFSRGLVEYFFQELGAPNTVLDPFMGVGTTLLYAKETGIPSAGLDVLPIALFVSKVKTQGYVVEEAEKWIRWFLQLKPGKASPERVKDPLVRKVFLPGTLKQILWYLDALEKVNDKRYRDLLKLILINSAMKCSFAFKDGAIVKVVKRPLPPLRNVLKREAKKVLLDIKTFHWSDAPAMVLQGDARRMPFEDESFSAIFTSPPYLNKIEYTTVYRVEHSLFFPRKVLPPLHSYMGLAPTNVPNNFRPELPLPARAYLWDMKRVLEECYRVLEPGGWAVFVVGNAYLGDFNVFVDVDEELAKIGEAVGFICEKIVVLNERWATVKRTKKVGKVRESAVILRKK